jgi:hypothetical protein
LVVAPQLAIGQGLDQPEEVRPGHATMPIVNSCPMKGKRSGSGIAAATITEWAGGWAQINGRRRHRDRPGLVVARHKG